MSANRFIEDEDPRHAAFKTLIEMAEKRLEGKVHRIHEARACAIGADFIREMSGSWHPDEMLWNALPNWCERLAALEKRLKVYE